MGSRGQSSSITCGLVCIGIIVGSVVGLILIVAIVSAIVYGTLKVVKSKMKSYEVEPDVGNL